MFAQDYYTTINTSTNISVEALNLVEFTSPQLAAAEADAADWISDNGSNAVRVAAASRTYNCHNYAWHYSDGGTNLWVNQLDQNYAENLTKYWSGASPTYQQTTSSNATKVFYSEGDHSTLELKPQGL